MRILQKYEHQKGNLAQKHRYGLMGNAVHSFSSFSGSHNREAFSSLHTLALRLSAISRRSLGGLAGRATVEMAVGVVALALCVVMAGSGDLVSRG